MKSEMGIGIKIELTPIITQDKKTGYYLAYFKEFPRASASDKNKKKVMQSLREIFQIMMKEKKKIL
ncbi:MAG: hypothetical protein ACRDE2_05210 [Chitinophagaceae bacterium]